jgi:hypothetical protein
MAFLTTRCPLCVDVCASVLRVIRPFRLRRFSYHQAWRYTEKEVRNDRTSSEYSLLNFQTCNFVEATALQAMS